MERFYYIERIQTWLSIRAIIAIFRSGASWTVTLQGNLSFTLTDEEYTGLRTRIEEIEGDWKDKHKKPE